MTTRFLTNLSKQGNNLVNVFNEILLGSTEIGVYDPSKTYAVGNVVLYYDVLLRKYVVLSCKTAGATGVFDELKWDPFDTIISADGTIDGGTF